MKKNQLLVLALTAAAGMQASAPSGGEGKIICSGQAPWCSMVAVTFEKSQGIKVNMTLKGSGEAVAQLMAERANPKTDIFFGGTADPHLVAAAQSGYKTVGIYSGPLGFGYNTELLAKKKLAVPKTWADLLKPEYKGEIQSANPASSGTAYTMIATLVQLMGEEQAFEYLKKLHGNIGAYTRSGTGQIKAVARGEATVSISFVHDGPGEKAHGFPLETITPADGTGAEIGSMSIIKGARNLDAAKKFYEWALTPASQALGAATLQFQLPSNKETKVDPRVPDFRKIKMIDYDYAKYGQTAERRRLILRWEKDVNSLPR